MTEEQYNYSNGLMRSYGTGALPKHNYSKEKPSDYKISLIKQLPVTLSGFFCNKEGEIYHKIAQIYVNKNFVIIFEMDGNTCHYEDVKNKFIKDFIIHSKERRKYCKQDKKQTWQRKKINHNFH